MIACHHLNRPKLLVKVRSPTDTQRNNDTACMLLVLVALVKVGMYIFKSVQHHEMTFLLSIVYFQARSFRILNVVFFGPFSCEP